MVSRVARSHSRSDDVMVVRTRFVLAAVVSATSNLAACIGGPSAAPSAVAGGLSGAIVVTPASRPIAIAPGDYWLQIYGHALSDEPFESVCSPPAVPAQGTSITTRVFIEREGSGWTARSTAGAGTLELRFAQTGAATPQGEALVGTIHGVAHDATVGPYRPATNVSVTLRGLPDDDAFVQGVGSPAVPFIYGQASGRIAFSDPTGASSGCRVAYWTLQPVGGALVHRAENAR